VKHKRTFAISLGLNLTLACAAVCLLQKSVSPMPGAAAATDSETATAPPPPDASNSPAPVAYVTNHFAWSRVEAEDFEQLALNLRAIGCPEKTVRDIVVARGRRALEQASSASEPKVPFWTAGLRRTLAKQEAERQARLSQAQIIARLERVVGPNTFLAEQQMMDELESQAIMRFMIGPVPDETFVKVAAQLAWFGERREDLDSRAGGVWLDTDEAELAQLRTRYHRELAALLPPAQLEEMTARMAMLPQIDRVKFETTDLNTAEVRQLGLIRARFSDPLSEGHSVLERDSLTDEQEIELQAAERQFLGEARFAQLERAADSDFKTLFSLGQDHKLPGDAAVKVFDLRKLTAQEAEHLRNDKALSDVDRQQRLAQIQADVQQAVLQVLGADASGQYLSRGGAWLTNVNGLLCHRD
jgi:hypothetical protein